MSETEKEQEPIKVRDHRRFDSDGNVRTESDETPAPGRTDVKKEQPGTAAGNDPPETTALQRELDAARKRVDELARAFQAINADREEYKQRLARERERLIDVEKTNVASVLLDVLDELELSLKAGADSTSPLAQGVALIRDGLLKKIQAMGLEQFEVKGKPFDPNVAEATDVEVTTDPAEDNLVTEVLRAGYRLNDRVVRPARVRVARFVNPASA